jgi:hypothetical protein
MKLSRRALLGTAVAGTAVAATGVALRADAAEVGTKAAVSPPGDVVGKITVGYQGWFTCAGDGAPINGWWHYGQDWAKTPSPANEALYAWPDVRDYTSTYKTGYATATASPPPCSRPTTSRQWTPTSAGCGRTTSTPPPCSGSTRPAARARSATP